MVKDKRKSLGEMRARQIMVQLGPEPSEEDVEEARKKIQEIYRKLQAGESFESLVSNYSEDYTTVRTKGEMRPFTMTSRLPQEIKEMAFSLEKDGQISEPFLTPFGFYIIQRLSLTPIGKLEDLRPTIISQISRDSRQYKNTLAVYNRLARDYKLKENRKYLDEFISTMDSSILKGDYSYKEGKLSSKVIFTLNKKIKYTIGDFERYLFANNAPTDSRNIAKVVEDKYSDFRLFSVMSYYEQNLEKTEPKFAAIYQEYKEGILLFNLTDKMVWSRSTEDSAGLKAFFEAHASKYRWTDRYNAVILRCSSLRIADEVKELIQKETPIDTIVRRKNNENPLNIKAQAGKFEKGDNFYADFLFQMDKKDDLSVLSFEDPKNLGGHVVVYVKEYIKGGPKTLDEAKGPVTSDYQDYLEKQWVENLNKKYPITVNEKAFEAFKKRITQ